MSGGVGPVAACVLVLGSVTCASRAQDTRPYLTEAERRVSEALDEPTELDFESMPLRNLVEYLKQRHALNIQLERDVDVRTPVAAHVKQVSLRRALRTVLGELGLAYAVQDGYVLITRADTCPLQLRIYPVGDLVTPTSDLRASPTEREAESGELRQLTDFVTANVAPTTWDDVGGPAGITVAPGSKALVVLQTQEGHEDLEQLLGSLRRTRDKQVAAAKAITRAAPATDQPDDMQVKVYRLESAKPVDGAPAVGTSDAEPRNAAGTAHVVQLNTFAKEIAALLPQVVVPESWQPAGKGSVRCMASALVVRQTGEVHRQIGRLLMEVIPDGMALAAAKNEPSLRLAVPGPQRDWPQAAEPTPDENTAAIERSLAELVDLRFHNMPLDEVVDAISKKHHVRILFEQEAMRDENVTTETPITRDLRGLTLRAALRMIVRDLGLSFAVRGDSLCITSIPCSPTLTCKIYPVFDLVVRPPQAPPLGPAIDFQPLIHLIQLTIAPTTWDEVGGEGQVTTFANAGALVVSQTTYVHEEIAEFLKALREVGAASKVEGR